MAILQSTDSLEKIIGNKYSLVIVAAKRARQIKEGHPPLVEDASPNPLSIALSEIAAHKVQPIAPPEEEIAPAPRDLIASLVSGAEFDIEEGELELEESDAVEDLAALLMGADEEEETEPEVVEEETVTAAADDLTESEEDPDETVEEEPLVEVDEDAVDE